MQNVVSVLDFGNPFNVSGNTGVDGGQVGQTAGNVAPGNNANQFGGSTFMFNYQGATGITVASRNALLQRIGANVGLMNGSIFRQGFLAGVEFNNFGFDSLQDRSWNQLKRKL